MFPVPRYVTPPLSHFVVLKGAFNSEGVDRIRFFKKILKFEKAVTMGEQNGNTRDPKDRNRPRSCEIGNLFMDQNTQWIFDDLAQMTGEVNYRDFMFDIEFMENVSYLRYFGADEDHYTQHRDSCSGGFSWNKYERKISIIAMLSDPDEYEGGEFEIDKSSSNSWEKIPLEKGDVMFFDSTMPHRVNNVTKGEREVLVSWIHGRRQ